MGHEMYERMLRAVELSDKGTQRGEAAREAFTKAYGRAVPSASPDTVTAIVEAAARHFNGEGKKPSVQVKGKVYIDGVSDPVKMCACGHPVSRHRSGASDTRCRCNGCECKKLEETK